MGVKYRPNKFGFLKLLSHVRVKYRFVDMFSKKRERYIILCPPLPYDLIGYDASRLGKKMNMFIFHRSRIEVESQL